MTDQAKVNLALTAIEAAEASLAVAKAALNPVPQYYMSNGVKLENVNFIWADRQNGIRQSGYELFGTQ